MSTKAEELFDGDDEEVKPAGAASVPPPPPKPSQAKVLTTVAHRGRPSFKIITKKGDGLYKCGNCQWLKTKWRRNPDKFTKTKRSCLELGVTAESEPCSFSSVNPLRRFNPLAFGDIGIPPDMNLPDIYLTRILLNRREEELLMEQNLPFRLGDKVHFIYQNKYFQGIIESFNRQHVYVKVKEDDKTEKILPLPVGSVTKV